MSKLARLTGIHKFGEPPMCHLLDPDDPHYSWPDAVERAIHYGRLTGHKCFVYKAGCGCWVAKVRSA